MTSQRHTYNMGLVGNCAFMGYIDTKAPRYRHALHGGSIQKVVEPEPPVTAMLCMVVVFRRL